MRTSFVRALALAAGILCLGFATADARAAASGNADAAPAAVVGSSTAAAPAESAAAPTISTRALEQLCLVLLNLHEFVFVD